MSHMCKRDFNTPPQAKRGACTPRLSTPPLQWQQRRAGLFSGLNWAEQERASYASIIQRGFFRSHKCAVLGGLAAWPHFIIFLSDMAATATAAVTTTGVGFRPPNRQQQIRRQVTTGAGLQPPGRRWV